MRKSPIKKQASSRSVLLLMEIIIAILFFSIVSAICLQLFVKAHDLGKATEELDMAVRQAGSAAEIISRSAQPMELLQKVYPDSDFSGDGGSIYFDRDFQMCPREDALYHLDISATSLDGRMDSYGIAFYRSGAEEAIYRLDITAYRQYTP